MGIGPFRFGGEKPTDAVVKGVVFELTSIGSQKIEKFDVDGKRFDVMSAIRDRGPSNIREISEEARISTKKTYRILKELKNIGWVRSTRCEEG